MILENINKFPIVVIGAPRSGTSIICNQIGIDLKIQHFNDITYSNDVGEVKKFYTFLNCGEKFVVKFHPHDLQKYPVEFITKITNSETYNVKVIRSNLIRQIASIYIAEVRNLYTYSADYKNDNSEITINLRKLIGCIQRTKKFNDELNNVNINFDCIIDYENCKEFSQTGIIKTPLPLNYNELIKVIEKYI